MAKYLFQASYTADGVKGVLSEGGTARRAAVEEMAASMGGTIESFYYAFGNHDLYIIVDAADHAAAAAIALTVGASGAAKVTTTVLLSPADVDAAVKKSPAYRAPGK
jgi:uncharacterized protein with GYD domain